MGILVFDKIIIIKNLQNEFALYLLRYHWTYELQFKKTLLHRKKQLKGSFYLYTKTDLYSKQIT